MPNFGSRSNKNLSTCHPLLQNICKVAIKYIDFSVIEGLRTDKRQNELFDLGRSKLKGGESMHNESKVHELFKPDRSVVSLAVDLMPWPAVHKGVSVWHESQSSRFIILAGIIQGIALHMGIILRWGGDWNNDFLFNEDFIDLPHFELKDIIDKKLLEL